MRNRESLMNFINAIPPDIRAKMGEELIDRPEFSAGEKIMLQKLFDDSLNAGKTPGRSCLECHWSAFSAHSPGVFERTDFDVLCCSNPEFVQSKINHDKDLNAVQVIISFRPCTWMRSESGFCGEDGEFFEESEIKNELMEKLS